MENELPENVLASWDADDWDDETMTASTYRYKDLETGDPIELSESQAAMYIWGQCEDNVTGGTQAGTLKNK